ncbi:MAG TPA: 3-deoxy-7-phosphoheptulonate synthase, partial [Chloroflexaceae bacterium]|nr:3-deoxy-7-phosphoheptulonate synthase [Chloroflexaceae bacterium]
MLVVMEAHARAEEVEAVCAEIRAMGFVPHPMPGPTRTAIGITGNSGPIEQAARLQRMPGVGELIRVTAPYKLVSREFRAADTVVLVGGVPIGGPTVTVIAGPCTVESREQTLAAAAAVRAAGATILRGGAYKPRTSPYAFQGLGEAG